jgi:hypothetical protein
MAANGLIADGPHFETQSLGKDEGTVASVPCWDNGRDYRPAREPGRYAPGARGWSMRDL